MKDKCTLVTGAGGFLGRHFVPALTGAGRPVRAMLRPGAPLPAWCGAPGVESCRADLLEPATLAPVLAGAHTVVHLAGLLNIPLETPAAKERLRRVNRDGTAHLLAACREAGVREFLFLSSVAAMGDPPRDSWADESTTEKPTRVYGESKLAAERLVLAARREWGLKTVTLRPVVVYGEGDKGNVVRMMARVRRGRFLLLAGGRARKSLVYAGNLAAAALHLLPIRPGWDGACYIAMDEPPRSVADLARAMAAALGMEPPRLALPAFPFLAAGALLELAARPFGRRPLLSAHTVRKLTRDLVYRGGRLGRETGFNPPFALEEALVRTAAWMKAEEGEH